jgi:hypothetical protein
MGNDGATTVAAVPVRLVYGKDERGTWFPMSVPKSYCDAVESGEVPAFVLIAGLGLSERN